jgi:hypothetical protein
LAELTEAEAMARLVTWEHRPHRYEQPSLPASFVTENGQAWLGPVPGVVA